MSETDSERKQEIYVADVCKVWKNHIGHIRRKGGGVFIPATLVNKYRIETGDLVSGKAVPNPKQNNYQLTEISSVTKAARLLEPETEMSAQSAAEPKKALKSGPPPEKQEKEGADANPEDTQLQVKTEEIKSPEKKSESDCDVSAGYFMIDHNGKGTICKKPYADPEDQGDHILVPPEYVQKFRIRISDYLEIQTSKERGEQRAAAILSVNGKEPARSTARHTFKKMIPEYPRERIVLEKNQTDCTGRMIDLLAPVGKGQRAIISAPPKAGKTTILKSIAHSIEKNHPSMHLIVLLVDERPEEVTDFSDCLSGKNTEIISSTFDSQPQQHQRAAKFVRSRAKALAEMEEDVVVLMDSLTRLTRSFNITASSKASTLSGGLKAEALEFPKKLFGSARCLREGGSITIIATALVETGSRMDDVIFEEFKGTGNMELCLDRETAFKNLYPAVNITGSSTRNDDLLLSDMEKKAQQRLLAKLPTRTVLRASACDDLRYIRKAFKETINNEYLCRVLSIPPKAASKQPQELAA